MATITTPDPTYTGPGPGGVHFVDGRAETDDIAVIGYCQGAGYTVDLTAADETPEQAPTTSTKQPRGKPQT